MIGVEDLMENVNTWFHCETFSGIVGEAQLRNYGHFMEDFAAQLRDIEDALDDGAGESWDITLDPIGLQVRLLFMKICICSHVLPHTCSNWDWPSTTWHNSPQYAIVSCLDFDWNNIIVYKTCPTDLVLFKLFIVVCTVWTDFHIGVDTIW